GLEDGGEGEDLRRGALGGHEPTLPWTGRCRYPYKYSARWREYSDHGQHPVALEGGDLTAVLLPLRTLVAEEELVDVLAEGLGQQLGVLGDLDRVVEVLRQLLEPEC